jgi:hypothetical protein
MLVAIAATGACLSGCLVVSEHQSIAGNPAAAVTAEEISPRVIYEDATRTISIGYTGSDGFRTAQEAAPRYCGERYGRAGAELLTDDRAAGWASFACRVQ